MQRSVFPATRSPATRSPTTRFCRLAASILLGGAWTECCCSSYWGSRVVAVTAVARKVLLALSLAFLQIHRFSCLSLAIILVLQASLAFFWPVSYSSCFSGSRRTSVMECSHRITTIMRGWRGAQPATSVAGGPTQGGKQANLRTVPWPECRIRSGNGSPNAASTEVLISPTRPRYMLAALGSQLFPVVGIP